MGGGSQLFPLRISNSFVHCFKEKRLQDDDDDDWAVGMWNDVSVGSFSKPQGAETQGRIPWRWPAMIFSMAGVEAVDEGV
jgi:hypothetical protein